MEVQMDITTIPDDIIERMMAVGFIEWGAVNNKTDEQHIEDFRDTLAITRAAHQMPNGLQSLHGCYLPGSSTIVCHTGTSPNSGDHARIIAGLWNSVLVLLYKHQANVNAQEGVVP